MNITKHLRRRAVTWAAAGAAAVAAASALSFTAASAAPVNGASSGPFTFAMVPSPGISSCLPHAHGSVTIIPGSENDLMNITISGMPSHAEFATSSASSQRRTSGSRIAVRTPPPSSPLEFA